MAEIALIECSQANASLGENTHPWFYITYLYVDGSERITREKPQPASVFCLLFSDTWVTLKLKNRAAKTRLYKKLCRAHWLWSFPRCLQPYHPDRAQSRLKFSQRFFFFFSWNGPRIFEITFRIPPACLHLYEINPTNAYLLLGFNCVCDSPCHPYPLSVLTLVIFPKLQGEGALCGGGLWCCLAPKF